MRNDTLFFTIAGMDTTRALVQSDRSQDFFRGHMPICLVCPTKALAEYVHARFVDAGKVHLHLNIDDTPGKMSVAVFFDIQLDAAMTLLPSDYEMISAIAGTQVLPLRAGIQRVVFGNGHDVDLEEYLSLKAELQGKGALAVVIGGVTVRPYYALPDSAVLFRARQCTFETHRDFMRRMLRMLG